VHLYDATSRPTMRHGHHHEELEVNVILRGWVEYLIGDRRVRFPQHALGWLLPKQTHRLIHRAPDLQMWIAVFTPDLVTDLDRGAAGPPPQWVGDESGSEGSRSIGAYAIELAALCERLSDPAIPASRHRIGLSWLLSECWQAHQDARGGPAGTQLHPAVQAAVRWLHDDATQPEAGDLRALARRCGISRPWLSLLFQEQLGESLTDYRNRQRFYRFRDLLADSVSATDAALAAGFGSYAQCFRVVREHTGLSPRELVQHLHRP
jgi:AraC-like DNA-binding protein